MTWLFSLPKNCRYFNEPPLFKESIGEVHKDIPINSWYERKLCIVRATREWHSSIRQLERCRILATQTLYGVCIVFTSETRCKEIELPFQFGNTELTWEEWRNTKSTVEEVCWRTTERDQVQSNATGTGTRSNDGYLIGIAIELERAVNTCLLCVMSLN